MSRTKRAATTKVNTAWLPYWSMSASYKAVIKNSDLISTASPFWYVARSCSSITGYSGAGSTWIINGLHARSIKVVPTITSMMSPSAAISCFGNPKTRKAHVAKVMAVVKSRRYDGLDFNYERLALTTSPVAAAKVRSSFNAFIKEVCSALRSAGKQCVVTVMPRTDDSYAVWRSKLIPGVYDYAVLGAASTKLRVMAYDQHAPNTSAGPIAGYPWTAAIARYTKSKVAASKVEMGVPLYGRNWASGTASTVTTPQAIALAVRYKAKIVYDAAQKAPYFRYTASGVRHTVWYTNATSVKDRVNLARSYGFRSVALWAPGMEDSAILAALRATGW
jgi:spore germination protein